MKKRMMTALLMGSSLLGLVRPADAVPVDSTILAQNSFSGSVSNVILSGDQTHPGDVATGDRVTGSYILSQDPNFATGLFFDVYLTFYGATRNYDMFLYADTASSSWGTLSFDQNDLTFLWNNNFPNDGLEATYFTTLPPADYGLFGLDIFNYASNDFTASGYMYWGDFLDQNVTIQFDVGPVPEPGGLLLIGIGLVVLTIARQRIKTV